MSAGAGRRPVVQPGVGLSEDELAQVAQLSHSQRYEMNKSLDQQGALLQGTSGRTVRSRTPPVVPPLQDQFALSSTAPSGLVYACAGRPSVANAGCPTSKSWPPEEDQRYQDVFPLNYRAILCIGYIPILGLEDGWEAVQVSVQCSSIRERLLLLQEIELLQQHVGQAA